MGGQEYNWRLGETRGELEAGGTGRTGGWETGIELEAGRQE